MRLLLLILVACVLAIDGHPAVDAQAKPTKATEGGQSTSQPSASPGVGSGSKKTEQKIANSEQSQPESSYLIRVKSPENLPNWIAAIATAVGAYFAVISLRALVRQTKATEDAAIAAKESTDIARKSLEMVERAYIAAGIPMASREGRIREDELWIPIRNRGHVTGVIRAVKAFYYEYDFPKERKSARIDCYSEAKSDGLEYAIAPSDITTMEILVHNLPPQVREIQLVNLTITYDFGFGKQDDTVANYFRKFGSKQWEAGGGTIGMALIRKNQHK